MNTKSSKARKDLAPSGRLRVAINVGNSVLAHVDAVTGAVKGVSVDLAKALASQIDVEADLTIFYTAGKVFEAFKRKEVDIVFLAIDPLRAAEIEFTPPYILIEGNYVVRANSSFKTLADIDMAGIRIAVARGSAYDLHLSRTIRNASLVRAPSGAKSMDMFLADTLEAVAGIRQSLLSFMDRSPGLRMIEPSFMVIEQAMGMPRDRKWGAAYLRTFIEEMKASGFVTAALRRSNQSGAIVAPPASKSTPPAQIT